MAEIKITHLERWINKAYHKYVRDYQTRINVFYGGAGSGKSHFITQKLILKSIQMKRKVLVVRKVGTSIKDSVWSMFLELLSEFSPLIASVNKSDYTIELTNGTVFLFKGLDDREKLKSITGITDIFIEEATELTLDDFTQLNLRLRSKLPYNQIHLAFNPVSKANWVYKMFFAGKKPTNSVVVHTTYKDNEHLTPEYISELHELRNTNPAYYRIYALGEFATLDKLVFPIIDKRIISAEETSGLPFWVGADFGYVADPTAIMWGFQDLDRKIIYITGEYFKRGMTNDEIADTIVRLGLSKERIIADCAEQKSIEEIRRLGIRRIKPSTKGKDSVIHGLDKMLRCKIVVDERLPNIIEEFENYTWEKDKHTGEYINRPIDTFNHGIDAIRYGLQGVRAIGSIEGIPPEFM